MHNFKAYKSNQMIAESNILAMVAIMDDDFSLSESEDELLMLESKISDMFGKVSLHIAQGKGLIHYLIGAGKFIGKLFVAAIKGDGKKVKELIKNIEAAEIIDFLLKLDQVTLHTLTGPIHFIDAVTGLHIGAAVHSAVKKATETVKDIADTIAKAFSTIKAKVATNIPSPKKTSIQKNLVKVEKMVFKQILEPK